MVVLVLAELVVSIGVLNRVETLAGGEELSKCEQSASWDGLPGRREEPSPEPLR